MYSEVARQLQSRILNKLKPGDMLPSERELVQWFGVSRGSIRDAIRSLEAIGLLEPRQGIGTIVREISAESVVTPVASAILQKRKVVTDLLDVRQIIEPALARRAAIHVTADQLAEMKSILIRQAEKVRLGEPATEEDSQFHYSIAVAAANDTVLKLLNVLMDLLRETRERSLQVKGRAQSSLSGHERILAALERGDAHAAEAAMYRHLSEIEEIVLEEL